MKSSSRKQFTPTPHEDNIEYDDKDFKNAKNELKEFLQNNNYSNNNFTNIKPNVTDIFQTISFGFTLEKSKI